ncbi:MAG: S9 family peptidase [Chloroflexi bacterium]|nr:S9 family peptidase [Chloroflexota bacterium]
MAKAVYDFSRYLNVRSAYGASFSPSGRRVAFLTDVTGVPQVWSVGVGGGWPQQLTFTDERVSVAAYAWHARHLVIGMDSGGNERQQLFLLAEDGSRLTPLTHNPETIHAFGGWAHDNRRMALASNERHPAYFDVAVLDTATGEARRVFEHDGTNYAVGWSPDDRALLVNRYTTNLDNDLFLLDLALGEVVHLTPHEEEAEYSSAAWAADGRGLYLITNQGRDFTGLAYLDLASRRLEYLATPDWDVETLALSRDGRLLAYVTNEDGYSTLTIRETATGREHRPPGIPRGVIADLAWSPDARRLAFTFRSGRYHADVWLLDREWGRVRRLTHSARGGIPQSAFVEPTLVRYPSFDGREIPAFLYLPPGARPNGQLPVLVSVHGGPEGQERPTFNPLHQYFVGRGYAVFAPNVRGSTGYGKAYTHLDDVRLRMDSVADLKAAVEWLRSSGYAHPRRIAVMGGSYGGFMTLAALTTYPDLWAAGVDVVGIANFITFLENTGPWRRRLREAEYGSLEHDADFLREISPIHHVDRITAPLMVIHGANDPRVPAGEAEQIVTALRSRGRPVEYLRFEDEGHGLVKRHNRIAAYTAVGDFLDRYLR